MKAAKFLLAVIFLLSMLFSCKVNDDPPTGIETENIIPESENLYTEGIENMKENSKYYEYADEAVKNLIENYWNEKAEIFYDQYPEKTASVLNYWWYAHAVDVLADAYMRTKNADYINYADRVIESVIRKNGKIINDYYDDMEWMALAILRLYNETGDEKYFEYVLTLWRDIQRGWNDTMGGGIAWRKEQLYYKNTPANAPASILASRIYNVTNDSYDLEWAEKIYDFVKNNLVDERSGQVWDGINRENNGKIDKNWNFTYCHGVYIGAGVELYKITGDGTYLEDAKKTAGYALDKFRERNGVFKAEGKSGDGGLFKGILIRYLTELYKTAPDMAEIKEALTLNADVLNEKGMNNVGNFTSAFDSPPAENEGRDLSVQLSGCMLFEMAAALNP